MKSEMTREGHVLDREKRARAGQSVLSIGGLAVLDSRDRFAAYAAHELRTPVALQRTVVEVTLADPDADAVALREMGERVLAGCEQQQRLIDALIGLVRSGCGLRRHEPVDLATIAADVLQADDPGGLEQVVALERAWTNGDPDLLERLAGNLVANAIRHNLADGRVEVATRTEAGRAVLSVANTGPPIPSSELERLFQPFQRLAHHSSTAVEGVGLGLAIVDSIAEAHRATVTARARDGGGLEIQVSFPAAPGRGSARKAAHGALRTAPPHVAPR
jgi:signal transduction histidine kinase